MKSRRRRTLEAILSLFFLVQPMSAVQADGFHLPIDIILDAGHGGVDSGTVFGTIEEKTINLQIAKKLYDLLIQEGVQVVLNRTDDYALSDENEWLNISSRHKRDLAQRKQLAVEVEPQIMVSLHVNWSTSRRQSGPLVLYQKTGQSYWLAQTLQQKLNHVYQSAQKPRSGKTYYLLNKTTCPTVIVEMGFLSNDRDRQLLTTPEGQARIAKSIAEGIHEYRLMVGRLTEE